MTIFPLSNNTLSPEFLLVEFNEWDRSNLPAESRFPWRVNGEDSLTSKIVRFFLGK